MNIDQAIDFLETDTLSVKFSTHGLKYLSLKGNSGDEIVDIRAAYQEENKNSRKYLLVKETLRFLETGSHNMILDLTEFTSFQQSVLYAVSKIKKGDIISYKGLAKILDNPNAAQAVGSATLKNPVSYFIPTHRVIPRNGLSICQSGAGFLRDKLLILEGHDITKLRGKNICTRKKCCIE